MRSFPHAWFKTNGDEADRVISDLPFLKLHQFQFSCHSGRYRSRESAAVMMYALKQNVQNLGDFNGLSPEWIKTFETQIGSFDDAEKQIRRRLDLESKQECTVRDWFEHWRGTNLLSKELERALLKIAESALSRWPKDGSFPINIFATSHDVCGELSAGKETPILKPGEIVVYQLKHHENVNRLHISSSQFYGRK